jgi:GcrA cell cycle regulator
MDGNWRNCWSDEKEQRLETLFRKGLSFSLIAADLGVTRNAVVGKAHRMKLPGRQPIECLPRPRSANPRIRRQAVRAVAVKKAKPKIIAGQDYGCTIYDLVDCSCRFPLWEINTPHPARLYCGTPGASVSTGVPYCERHSLVCGTSREN